MKSTKPTTLRWFLLVMIALVGWLAFTDLGRAANGALRRSLKDPGVIRDYLASHPVRKLQLGAGGNDPKGWLNSDIEPNRNEVYLDVTERYPLPDASFQYAFSEHVIEHVPWEGGLTMLKECHRVLAPGGKLRVVTPNLAKFVQLLGATPDAAAREFMAAKLRLHRWPDNGVSGAYILNRQAREWGHQFLYDPATLRKSLELAGFQQITEHTVDVETDPVFREAEVRIRDQGSPLWVVNRWEAMAFEAVR